MSTNFAFVQVTPGTGSVSTQTFGADVSEGDAIIAFVVSGSASTIQGPCGDITDTQGNRYSLIQQSQFGGTTIYAAIASATGALTVNNNVGGTAFIAKEYSSVAAFDICPGSVWAPPFNTTNVNFRGSPGSPTTFSSASECMVVWGRSLGGNGTFSVTKGTIRHQGVQQLGGVNNYVYAVGDDDEASLATSYTNDVEVNGVDSGGGCSVILNLTNSACSGGITAAAPPQTPGQGGTGQPDSSFGPTGSSAVPAANSGVLLVYFEKEDRWMYHRNSIGISRFYGFLFDGLQILGLTGTTPSGGSSNAVAFNVDDFRGFLTQDEPLSGMTPVGMECVFQSHFEDVGLPDNQKNWLEIVVDYVLGTSGSATVYVGYDDGTPSSVGSLSVSTARKQLSFPLGTDGVLAKNISVLIDAEPWTGLEIHNVYLYYYVEARLALAASTIPIDLGSPQVKQCKELMLDIDASNGVDVNIYSDLPGNQLAVNQAFTDITSSGRAIMKFPFTEGVVEGFLWRVALTANSTGTFRLYSARLLMRPIGVYVEAYESAAGFVYDSEPHSFESLITRVPRAYAIALSATPIKRFRELSLEIETFNENVTVSFLTDLPGETETVRLTFTVNTALLGRRYVRLPFPLGIGAAAYNSGTTYAAGAVVSYQGTSYQSLASSNTGNTPSYSSTHWQPLPIEGRMCRLQLSGSAKYVLYDAAVELLAVGVYVEAYEASGGAVYDSREMDFGSLKPKEARELELDIETTGAVTATLYCDLPGYTMAQCFQNTGVSTTGRQKVLLPLTLDSAPFDYPIGRMFRLVITGSNSFRLYGAQLKMREFGTYLVGDEASASPAGVWDSTPLDLGTERLKEFKKLEIEIQTDSTGTATLNLWTDQPAGALTSQFTTTISTSATRQSVKIPLSYGIRGRLVQIEISGCGVRLFNGRIWARPFNEPKAQWAWAPLPIPPTAPDWGWAQFPVNPTPPANDPAQWLWGKFLSVTETPDEWTWVDVPFEVTGP